MNPEIVLASASPRRRELLESAGYRVRVQPSGLVESRLPGEAAASYVLRLARAKAEVVAAHAPAGMTVLGADTVVVLGGEIFGKPQDDAEARAMLTRLAGRRHEVLTGVCLYRGAAAVAAVETTAVWFAALTADEVAAYVASGEPQDKAGAYAIQGRAASFIPRIEGSYSNVVGLPLALVAWLLRRIAD